MKSPFKVFIYLVEPLNLHKTSLCNNSSICVIQNLCFLLVIVCVLKFFLIKVWSVVVFLHSSEVKENVPETQ